MALTKVSPNMISDIVINIASRGAGQGGADDSVIIQTAIDELTGGSGGTIYFPVGTYLVQNQIAWKSNVHYKGEGKNSLIKVNATPGQTYIFNQASTGVDNVVFDGIGFDGTINYITDGTIYKATYANKNWAIRTGGIIASNVIIRNCYFNKLSGGSIDLNSEGTNNIIINGNEFIDGCYTAKVIRIRTPTGNPPANDSDRPNNIIITDNIISGGGPTYYYDPTKLDWTASTDAISIDSCRDVTIGNNSVNNIASVGIRIEQTLRATVQGNNVAETGGEGITFYNSCFACTCTGNTVYAWGKIPPASSIRSYGGSYYYAKEFPAASGTYTAVLPADPSGSSWFAIWPYNLDNVNVSGIPAYSDTDYYTGTSGILPFRGNGGIACTSATTRTTITGNQCTGNITVDGSGKYYYASDHGYTNVHPVNSPSSLATSGDNCKWIGNIAVNSRVYTMWFPRYGDPVNTNGLMGVGLLIGNRDDSSSIYTVRNASTGNVLIKQNGDMFLGDGVVSPNYLSISDGITAPSASTGGANIYVDTADGDLKIIFSDGTIKTISTDT